MSNNCYKLHEPQASSPLKRPSAASRRHSGARAMLMAQKSGNNLRNVVHYVLSYTHVVLLHPQKKGLKRAAMRHIVRGPCAPPPRKTWMSAHTPLTHRGLSSSHSLVVVESASKNTHGPGPTPALLEWAQRQKEKRAIWPAGRHVSLVLATCLPTLPHNSRAHQIQNTKPVVLTWAACLTARR